MISTRTKAALEAAKRRGVKFGNPRYTESIGKARLVRSEEARKRNHQWLGVIRELQNHGCHRLVDLAEGLNARGYRTSRGSSFCPASVHRVLKMAA
jgi:DNA invertase Pin-like site-specific DNA recombinase